MQKTGAAAGERIRLQARVRRLHIERGAALVRLLGSCVELPGTELLRASQRRVDRALRAPDLESALPVRSQRILVEWNLRRLIGEVVDRHLLTALPALADEQED